MIFGGSVAEPCLKLNLKAEAVDVTENAVDVTGTEDADVESMAQRKRKKRWY